MGFADERDFEEERVNERHYREVEQEGGEPWVSVNISHTFFDEARPWHEDWLKQRGSDDAILYTYLGPKRLTVRVASDLEIVSDLLDFAENGAEGFSRGGGMDMGDPKTTYRYAAMYRTAAKSIRKQLVQQGFLDE